MMNKAPAIRTTQTKLMAIGIRHDLGVSSTLAVELRYVRSALDGVCTKTDGGTDNLSYGQHQLPTEI